MMNLRGHASFLLAVVFAGPAAQGQWLQWGGTNRDFKIVATGLASEWPEGGPPKIWKRELGDGYSTIVGEGNRLYTMYRKEDKERVVCLDRDTGRTNWEHAYDVPVKETSIIQFGEGPHSTPLIVGDRIFTVGVTMILHCLDKQTGQVFWMHDLHRKFG